MRVLKAILLLIIAVVLVIVGFANRQTVDLTLLPPNLVPFVQYNVSASVPLYAVAFCGIGIGLLLGFLFEWFRERRFRRQAMEERRTRQRLEREIAKMKRERGDDEDDVRSLVDGRSRPAA